jgi:hypothetical protein
VKLLAAITNTIIELPGESGIDEALSNILYEGID